jgi:hypothetical protein
MRLVSSVELSAKPKTRSALGLIVVLDVLLALTSRKSVYPMFSREMFPEQ